METVPLERRKDLKSLVIEGGIVGFQPGYNVGDAFLVQL